MKLVDAYPQPEERQVGTVPDVEITHERARYEIISFTEESNPAAAEYVQRIQGECYVRNGFVHPSALDADGRMFPELDRSRGSNITYYLATPHIEVPGAIDHGSLRVADIPEGGTIDDLAAFRHARGTMYEGMEELLRRRAEQGAVREVMALANTRDASSMVSFELIRQVTQEAIKRKTDELWVINFVPHAYTAIRGQFGASTVLDIGTPLAIDVGDERTSDKLRLMPVVIEPCRVIDQISDHLHRQDISDDERERVSRSLLFLLDGLADDDISAEAAATVAEILRRME